MFNNTKDFIFQMNLYKVLRSLDVTTRGVNKKEVSCSNI